MKRVLAHAFANVAILVSIAGAQPQTAPETATRELDSPATFRTKVSLVLVPVVVRDKKGVPIGTLKKDDFELYDKGKLQVIEKFSVEKASSRKVEFVTDPAPTGESQAQPSKTPVEVADRFTAYLFDDLHFNTADLMRVRLVAEQHLNNNLDPAERVAIYSTSGRITQEFTANRGEIKAALDKIMTSGMSNRQSTRCPPMTYYMADRILNKENDTYHPFFDVAVDDAMQCLGLPKEAQVVAVGAARAAAQDLLSTGFADARQAILTLRNTVRTLSTMPGQRHIVLVSPGIFIEELHEEVQGIIDRAIRARVLIDALDGRGLHTLGTVPDASQRILSNNVNLKMQMERWNAEAGSMFMWEVAEGTGGSVVENTNDLAGGFRKLTSIPEFTYILGFSPQNLKLDGKFRALKVKLKSGSGFSIQARRGYYAPKQLADPAEQTKLEMQEALFSRDVMDELPMELHTQYFKSTQFEARLGVVARVDVAQLKFRKAEGRNFNNLTVMTAIFDGNGNLLKGTTKLFEMKLRDETLINKSHSFVTIKNNFDVNVGKYVIRVVIRDSESNLMAAQNGAVIIP